MSDANPQTSTDRTSTDRTSTDRTSTDRTSTDRTSTGKASTAKSARRQAPPRARRRAKADVRAFDIGRPVILGILNVTPDSFSDGREHRDTASAIEFATHLVESGADVIDVGGESTRPGADRVSVEEEQRRVIPVLKELAKLGIPISIDTMNAWTAGAAIELGAAIINDVSGGAADPDMAKVAADSGAMFIAVHSRMPSATMNDRAVYSNTLAEVRTELEQRVASLVVQGVEPERIVIDPGLGFSKNSDQNWQLLGSLKQFGAFGHPVLVGASRKRFLGDLLPSGTPMRKRDAATAVISALAAEAGAWGVRVHDVAATKAALDVWVAMNGARR